MSDTIDASMFRVKGEFPSLLLGLAITLTLGFLLVSLGQLLFNPIQIALFFGSFVTLFLLIKLIQAQYLGNAIRVHDEQFPDVYKIFKKQAIALNTPRVSLYIEQSPLLNASTIGLGNAAIVATSGLVEALNPNELAFVMAHELGHFKAGHTKLLALLGSTKSLPYGNYFMNFWGRNAEYSADRCGLVLTRDIDSAVTSMMKLAIGGKLFKEIDVKGYIAQIKKADNLSVQLSETLVDHPFVTNRIVKLLEFWRTNFKKTDE